jgi:hypothetical protein
MFSLLPQTPTPPNPFLLLGLTLLALATIFPLIVVCEVVVFQIMRWGAFRACLKAAAQVNAVSSAIGLGLMLLAPRPNVWQLLIFLALSIVMEALLLNRIKPGASKANWIVSLLANAVSYIVLILPAFRFQ